MPRNPNQYVIDIDYSPEQRKKLKKFCALIGAKSVRQFVAEAIDFYINDKVNTMPEKERDFIEDQLL